MSSKAELIKKVRRHHRKIKSSLRKGTKTALKAWSKNMLAIKKLKARHATSR